MRDKKTSEISLSCQGKLLTHSLTQSSCKKKGRKEKATKAQNAIVAENGSLFFSLERSESK